MSFQRSLRVEGTAKGVCTFVVWILLTAITRGDEPPMSPTTGTATTPPSAAAPATPDASTQSSTTWYQLVNVTIPPDSPLRNDVDTNRPPELYIVLKRNGLEVDVKCTAHKGWSVDFAQVPDGSVNVWPIRQGTTDRFTVEVWDNHVWNNHMVFNVTGLSGLAPFIEDMLSRYVTDEELSEVDLDDYPTDLEEDARGRTYPLRDQPQ